VQGSCCMQSTAWAGVDSEWRGAYLASYPQESIEPIIAVAAHVQRGRQGSGRERGLRVACALRYTLHQSSGKRSIAGTWNFEKPRNRKFATLEFRNATSILKSESDEFKQHNPLPVAGPPHPRRSHRRTRRPIDRPPARRSLPQAKPTRCERAAGRPLEREERRCLFLQRAFAQGVSSPRA
jgi:hypothetical protein